LSRSSSVAVGFKCSRCVEGAGVLRVQARRIDEGNVGKLECVSKFCYLEDMVGFSDGTEEASRARVWCA
jgi:hypothetical protein